MVTLLISLCILNTLAHLVAFKQLSKAKDPSKIGVLIFAFINTSLALLFSYRIEWAKWPALIFPLLGGSLLVFTTILKGKGTWIEYVLLLLDIGIIITVLTKFII